MAMRHGRRSIPAAPRAFYLLRRQDVSGVSGTGVVAVGAVMPSGRAVLEWCSAWPTITVFDSWEQVVRIHGHQGRTELHFGPPPAPRRTRLGTGGVSALWRELTRRWQPPPDLGRASLSSRSAPPPSGSIQRNWQALRGLAAARTAAGRNRG
jgi:hypothetical protein